MLKIINQDELKENLKGEEKVILNFFADWCGPCKMMGPIFEDIAADGTKVLKVNVDNNQEVAREYGVQGIPATFVIKSGEVKWSNSGYLPKDKLLEEFNKI